MSSVRLAVEVLRADPCPHAFLSWPALVEPGAAPQGVANLIGRFGHVDKVAKAVVPDTPSYAPAPLVNPSMQEGTHLLLP